MRFTLSSSALNERLQALFKVINSKNSLSILESFRFQVSNGQVMITASDGENVMQSRLTAPPSEEAAEKVPCVHSCETQQFYTTRYSLIS